MQPSVMHASYTTTIKRQSSHVSTLHKHAACSVVWFYVCACVCPWASMRMCVCMSVCVCVCARRHSNDHFALFGFGTFNSFSNVWLVFERLLAFQTFDLFSNVLLTWPLTSMWLCLCVCVCVCALQLIKYNWR